MSNTAQRGSAAPALRQLPKSEWRGFFDLGDQIVAEWVPLIGITYDSRDDLLDVALDRAGRLIRRPQEIAVEEGPAGLASVAVVDADGARHVVRLKDPVMLPAAGTAG